MKQSVYKIMLFTLNACPMGRSMGAVLNEIKLKLPQIQFETIHVEVMTDITNHYRIKKNPTVLILDEAENELYRIEGFIETKNVIEIIEKLNNKVSLSNNNYEMNKETIETYTIYLYKNNDLVPIEKQYTNLTSVQAPRITAIHLLINSKIDGYKNPFPSNAALELVNFDQNRGKILIHVKEEVDELEENKMKCALTKTLTHFGIDDIELTIIN